MNRDSKDQGGNAGRVASWGALLAAVLSSACCWLPLTAIGLGASVAGVGAFFESWRLPLLVLTVGLLGAGFYFVHRKPQCAPGEICGVPRPRLQRFNRLMLWLTTVFVAAFALFPEYVTVFAHDGEQVLATSPEQTESVYRIDGMTCAGCVTRTLDAIENVPGVVSAAVSYEAGETRVVWSSVPDHEGVAEAVSELGFTVQPSERLGTRDQ